MARSGVSALCFAFLLAFVELGSCLRCFQCNSQNDPTCKDPFVSNSQKLMDCGTQESVNYNRQYLVPVFNTLQDGVPGASRYCHKIVMQTGTVVRTCLDANPSNLGQTCNLLEATSRSFPGDSSRQIKSCSVCDKDGCNGAGSITASLPLALIAAFVAYLFCK